MIAPNAPFVGYLASEPDSLPTPRLALDYTTAQPPSWRQLNREQIEALPQGAETIAWVQLYRLFDPAPLLVWEGISPIQIEKRMRPLWPSESPIWMLAMTLGDWAEYDGVDIHEDGQCVIEDYAMDLYRADGHGKMLVVVLDADRDGYLRYAPIASERERVRHLLPPMVPLPRAR